MEINYIIVQAGGKGTRMEHLTHNKPKALVPVSNLPMLFHCFKKFENKKFIIIGDYKCDVLKRYLSVFAKVPYIVVDAKGAKGTCGGIDLALELIPDKEAFLLVWSDLVLSDNLILPENLGNYIGISKDFECRWSYEDESFEEKSSKEHGVAGFFIFEDKGQLQEIPKEGEFVRWLQTQNKTFSEIGLYSTKEYGLISEYKKIQINRCRPFNYLRVDGDKIIKEGIDDQGRELAVKEKAWYKYVKEKGFVNIPFIYSFEPFVMERIKGKNIYEYDLDDSSKRKVLKNIVNMLEELHALEKARVDYFSVWNTYFYKTFDRLNKVQNLIPFALEPYININGRKCRNVFYFKKELEHFIEQYRVRDFCLIHGDCTFSNMMLNEKKDPILIDPRGYFGNTLLFGDEVYDWAKVYYSLFGDYDQFNLKRFVLNINEDTHSIDLKIQTNGWKDLEEYFFELLEGIISRQKIKMLHAIIWLSLTTYAWEDYDSICGAFYNGLFYFEEALNELS